MSFSDRIRQAAQAAKEAAAEHKQQVEHAIDEAGRMADEQTGGRYASQIAKARAGADRYVEGLQPERPEEEPGGRQP